MQWGGPLDRGYLSAEQYRRFLHVVSFFTPKHSDFLRIQIEISQTFS
jgi:hypothetical protein